MQNKIIDRKIVVFNDKDIRRTFHHGEWWFVISDIIAAVSNSSNPSGYLKDMRNRDAQLKQNWKNLTSLISIETTGGTQQLNCANTESIFRIIQSVPSAKAEPFKRWLAKVGYERIQEIEDPELAATRARTIYKAKGYSDEWIEKRMRSIAIREELTQEWQQRGVKQHIEYAILTAEISKATFGVTPAEYKQLKQLKHENLRDHMTDLELIFSMLGEASTTEITRTIDAQDFDENKVAAKQGGQIAGNARGELEQKTGRSVVTARNHLDKEITKN